MSYTQEQLNGMSDTEVEEAMSELLGSNPRPFNQDEYDNLNGDEEEYACSRTIVPFYCTDWSVTGPLMVEYGISLSFSSAGSPHAYSSRGCRYDSYNENPLRAVCEVILMMGKA